MLASIKKNKPVQKRRNHIQKYKFKPTLKHVLLILTVEVFLGEFLIHCPTLHKKEHWKETPSKEWTAYCTFHDLSGPWKLSSGLSSRESSLAWTGVPLTIQFP